MTSKSYNLNQRRFLYGKITAGIAIFLAIFTENYISNESFLHEINDSLGMALIALCALGRVYCSVFIGGIKNQQLITSGPFSVCRNPLYFFSFLGTVGIGLYSNQITILVLLTASFLLVYRQLIKREEAFLLETFGQPYADYVKAVPRFVPKLSLYKMPETVEVRLKPVQSAAKDAIVWFSAIVIFEVIEYLHNNDIIPIIAKVI